MLDTSNKLSCIEVTDNITEIHFTIKSEWLDLSLSACSEKLFNTFLQIRNQIKFDKSYYHIILEDECEVEETEDFVDLYMVELVNAVILQDSLKFKEENWASSSDVWDKLNLTETLKRKLLNYETIMQYFNVTILGKDGTVVYQLLED